MPIALSRRCHDEVRGSGHEPAGEAFGINEYLGNATAHGGRAMAPLFQVK
jgi:hypothetical protein